MTRHAPLWQQNGSYPAVEDRGLLGTLWPSSRSTGGLASAVANTMQLSIAPGTAAVALQLGQQTALCRWDAAELVTLAASPASGQTRRDLIVLQVRDQAIDAGTNNDFIFQAITGNPTTGTPVTPATPVDAYALYYVTVTGGQANLNGAVITDLRQRMPGLVANDPPIYTGSEPAGIASMVDASGEVWVAKAGVNGGAWKRARDVLHSWVYRTAPFSIPAGSSPLLGMDTVRNDDYGLYSTIGGAYVLPVGGWWHVECHLAGGAAAGNWLQSLIVSSINGVLSYGMCHTSSGVWNMATASLSARFVAGDVISFQMSCSNGQPGNPGQQATYGTADYMGSN